MITETATTLTSYVIGYTNDAGHVWPKDMINERLLWIIDNHRYGLWAAVNEENDTVTTYFGLLDPEDRVVIVYVLEP